MKIKSIRFRNVGPFGAAGIRLDGFTPGLNVVCETNEFGKSTVLKALEIILFKPFSSTDKHVKALRTENAEAGPEGEIGFSSDGKEYRFSKTFLKSKGARLQDAQTGEVLAIDRAAEEALAKHLRSERFEGGPSGLLWVRQGRSMEGVSDDGQVASRLEGELGTLIGGDRARAYLTRVETELAEDLTPRRQEKKSGPLRMARDAVDATQAELAEALRLRETTTSIGVELARVTAEIDILNREAETDNQTQDINKIQLAINAARHFADGLKLLKAKQAEAEAAAKRASTRQAEYISALVSYNNTVKRLTDLDNNHQVKSKALAEIVLRRDDTRKKTETLESRLDELDQIRSRRDAFTQRSQRLQILQKDMQQLGAYLEQHEALNNQQSKLTDQISDLPVVTRKDVETLRLAADDVRQYEMELAALSTHLYLDLTPKGAGKISLNGKPLKAGPIELPGGAALKIDGIGELRSDDSQLRETRRKLDQAQQAHMALLDRYSVSDTAEASKFADQRHDLEEERKHVTSDMARLAPEGLSAIETNYSLAETEARGIAEQLTDAQAELGDADDRHVMEELRAERAKFGVIEETLTTAQQALADIKTEQARLGERVKSLNLAQDPTERDALADKLAGEKLKAEAKARSMMTEVTDQNSKAPGQSLNMLEARLTRLQQSSNNARQKLESLKTKQAGLQARRDAAFEGGDADAIVTSLKARLGTEQNMLSRRVRSKDVRLLLQKTLIETQNRLRDAYTAPVTQELTPLLSHVFPGAEAGLGDSLGVDTVLRDGKLEKISQLSGGTQEQFAILTRLAYARLLTRNGASAPVILDDALVYADDARRDAMFDVLGLVSTGQNPIQIVYLSCHAAASRRLGGNRITPQPW